MSGDKTDYVRTISTLDGSGVSVSVYYQDQLVPGTPVIAYPDGSPLLVGNDRLNVIEISFQPDAEVIVKIKDAQWDGIVHIEKDFEMEQKELINQETVYKRHTNPSHGTAYGNVVSESQDGGPGARPGYPEPPRPFGVDRPLGRP